MITEKIKETSTTSTPKTTSSPTAESKDKEIKKILKSALQKKSEIAVKQRNEISEESIIRVIEVTRLQFNLENNESALSAIAILLQKGGCNANRNTSITISFDNKTIGSKEVNTIIRNNCKNITPRAFARAIAKEIFEISKFYDVPGNIAIKIKRTQPEAWDRITEPDKEYWASDFQLNTEGIPPPIANLIQVNYQNSFRTRSTFTNTNTTK